MPKATGVVAVHAEDLVVVLRPSEALKLAQHAF